MTDAARPLPTGLVRLDCARFRRTPWKNGGGMTVDIADCYRPGAEPGGWTGMIWRLGRTRIDVPAPFSDLSGNDRILTVIGGRGLVLRADDGTAIDAREPFCPVRFRGELPVRSELEDGPVEVLNLMAARDAVEIDVRILQPGSAESFGPAELVVYAPCGAATLRLDGHPVDIPAGDALRFTAAGETSLAAQADTLAVAVIRMRPERG